MINLSKEEMELLKLAKDGNLDAQIELGKDFGDLDISFWPIIEKYLIHAIENGRELEGNKWLGMLYTTEIYSPIYDARKGVACLEKYIELGGNDDMIYSQLGFVYRNNDVCMDLEKAFYYYSHCGLEYAEDILELAEMYIYGIGVNPDIEKATILLRKLKRMGCVLEPLYDELLNIGENIIM